MAREGDVGTYSYLNPTRYQPKYLPAGYDAQDYIDWVRAHMGSNPYYEDQALWLGETQGLTPSQLTNTSFFATLAPKAMAATAEAASKAALESAKTVQEYAQTHVGLYGTEVAVKYPEPLVQAALAQSAKRVKTLEERVREAENQEFETEDELWDFLYRTFSEQELRLLLGG